MNVSRKQTRITRINGLTRDRTDQRVKKADADRTDQHIKQATQDHTG